MSTRNDDDVSARGAIPASSNHPAARYRSGKPEMDLAAARLCTERRSEIAKTAAAASAKVRSKKAKERAALDKKLASKAAAKKGNE